MIKPICLYIHIHVYRYIILNRFTIAPIPYWHSICTFVHNLYNGSVVQILRAYGEGLRVLFTPAQRMKSFNGHPFATFVSVYASIAT